VSSNSQSKEHHLLELLLSYNNAQQQLDDHEFQFF
jgi:hypothetical protein